MQWKTKFAENIFKAKYSNGLSWGDNTRILIRDVCSNIMPVIEQEELIKYIIEMKFIPAGRYLYYAGQKASYYNNCFCFKAEHDTKEEWARLEHDAMLALMCGGGIGIDYSKIRPSGRILSRTGGTSSGAISLMHIINETGRHVMQGGSRRSAMFASLIWNYGDIKEFLYLKDWSDKIKEIKVDDFNFPAPMDMTNISVNYDDLFLRRYKMQDTLALDIWNRNISQMLKTGEPGMCFNFGKNTKDTLRNACGEFTSENDSDICNLGSVNFGAIESADMLARVSYLASKFLVCGGYRAALPTKKTKRVREENRKIGLGIMGLHEWMLKRDLKYGMSSKLKEWLDVWVEAGELGANQQSNKLYINMPKKYRAIAPTGTIGILAGTTTGVEPLYAVAYKRRYLSKGTNWQYEYVIDSTAQQLIKQYNLNPNEIETARSLANDPERRIKFQYDLQKWVDMGISSTLNLPAFDKQAFTPDQFSAILMKYIKGLRGITTYPDGARGGQPLTEVPYEEAITKVGNVYTENTLPESAMCDT